MVLAAAVVVWVAVSIRPRPSGAVSAEGETPTNAVAEGDNRATRMTEYKHLRLGREGREIVVRAKGSVGTEQDGVRLDEADLAFTYMSRGKLEKGAIVAKECVYKPAEGSAMFKGSVKVSTEDGFSLDTESLRFDQQTGMSRTEDAVAFRRKDVSGTGRGLVYDSNAGTVQIDADMVLNVADEDGTTVIRSQRAVVNRAEQTIRFIGDVVMTKGSDELRSAELTVNFDEAGDAVHRAEAMGGAYARFVGQQGLGPVDQTGGSGLRELRGQKLDIFFRPDRSIERMEAGPEGRLSIHPGAKDPQEIRHLTSRLLTFFFDDAGRLSEVQGHKDSGFVSEPVKAGGGPGRSMVCQNFVARFDVATGQLDHGDFNKDVKFARAGVEATANTARYELHRVPGGLLMLKDGPQVVDAEHGSRLTAIAIDVEVESGNVIARREVRHVIPPRPSAGLVGSEAETVVTSRLFRSDSRQGVFVYTGEAVMRSGQDELRGEKISIEQGGRKVRAEGQVASRLTPKEKDKERVTVEAQARRMLYDEAARRIDYEVDVVMKHGEVTTRSPRASVHLGPDGKRIDRLEAGPSVAFEQAKRQGSGQWGVYKPDSKLVTLTGDARLTDEQGQKVRGDRISFKLDERAIQVQGQQARTETILRKEPALPGQANP